MRGEESFVDKVNSVFILCSIQDINVNSLCSTCFVVDCESSISGGTQMGHPHSC
jgi:hypothetical protein